MAIPYQPETSTEKDLRQGYCIFIEFMEIVQLLNFESSRGRALQCMVSWGHLSWIFCHSMLENQGNQAFFGDLLLILRAYQGYAYGLCNFSKVIFLLGLYDKLWQIIDIGEKWLIGRPYSKHTQSNLANYWWKRTSKDMGILRHEKLVGLVDLKKLVKLWI